MEVTPEALSALAAISGAGFTGLLAWFAARRRASKEDKTEEAQLTVVAAQAVGNVVDTVREMLKEERAAHLAERSAHQQEQHRHQDCIEMVSKQNGEIAQLKSEGKQRDSDIAQLRRKVRRLTGEDTASFNILETEEEA